MTRARIHAISVKSFNIAIPSFVVLIWIPLALLSFRFSLPFPPPPGLSRHTFWLNPREREHAKGYVDMLEDHFTRICLSQVRAARVKGADGFSKLDMVIFASEETKHFLTCLDVYVTARRAQRTCFEFSSHVSFTKKLKTLPLVSVSCYP